MSPFSGLPNKPMTTSMKAPTVPFLSLLCLLLLVSCEPEKPTVDASQYQDTASTGQNLDDLEQTAGMTDRPGMKEDYINTNRVIWQKPEVVIDFMGDISDKVVADIGAGTGFFAFRLAREAKKVIAIDIDQVFIDYLDSAKVMELPEADQPRLEARFATPTDPNLQPGEANIIMMVNTYMWIPQERRVDYLKKLYAALPENGEVLILDFKKKRTPVGPAQEPRVPLFVTEIELEQAGFRDIETNDKALDYQYIVMGRK
jgi:SAM-dependent methyltransferase